MPYFRPMRWIIPLVACVFSLLSCDNAAQSHSQNTPKPEVYIKVLGVTQDAGFPQIGCEKECCKPLWKPATPGKYVVSLGLVDSRSNEKWIFEATPDFKHQLALLNQEVTSQNMMPNGIFLTHAHMGHYSGILDLGREAINASKVPVHVMPRMADFLKNNAPWSQLVELENIVIDTLSANKGFGVNSDITVTPILVPHRDEFSETVSFIISGPNRRATFIPDIDKWHKWGTKLHMAVKATDVVFIDGTFFEEDELPGRNMEEIPHPFIVETMDLLKDLDDVEKAKVHFIHFNHTNPILRDPKAVEKIKALGFNIAEQGQIVPL